MPAGAHRAGQDLSAALSPDRGPPIGGQAFHRGSSADRGTDINGTAGHYKADTEDTVILIRVVGATISFTDDG